MRLGAGSQLALSVVQCARALRVPVTKIREMIAAGKLAHVRLGDRRLIAAADLQSPADDSGLRLALCSWCVGRERVRLSTVARSLGVSDRLLKRLSRAGAFPAAPDAKTGRWLVGRREFVRWILAARVPAAWEHEHLIRA